MRHEYIAELDGPQSRVLPGNRRILAKGGGGDQAYYRNAERLYGVQADTAQFLLGLSKERLPGAVGRFDEAATKYFDPDYETQLIGQANIDAQNAFSGQKAGMTRDMARYGLNPASGRWGSMMNQGAIQGAAMQAGAANNARQYVQDKRFATAKDYYGSLTGMPSDAASMAGRAASGYSQMGANKQNAASNEAAGWGSAVGMGMGAFFAKDGGEIRMQGGGLIPKFDQQMPAQPAQQPQQSMGGNMAQGFKAGSNVMEAISGKKAGALTGKIGNVATNAGNLFGDVGMASYGTGLQGAAAGTDMAGAIGAYNEAATAAGLAGDAASAAEFASVAEGLGAGSAAGSTGLMAAASTAMPYVAAAAAVGQLFGLFAEGGEVSDVEPDTQEAAKANIYESLFSEPYTGAPEQIVKVQQLVQSLMAQGGGEAEGREDMTAGGEVDGPGHETSDSIPARLSDGEYVVNAEALKIPGVREALEQINNAGLQRRYGEEPGYADGGDTSVWGYLWDKATGKKKDPAVEKAEREAAARKLAGPGMIGNAGNQMRNSLSKAEEEANRQIRGYRKGGLVKKGC